MSGDEARSHAVMATQTSYPCMSRILPFLVALPAEMPPETPPCANSIPCLAPLARVIAIVVLVLLVGASAILASQADITTGRNTVFLVFPTTRSEKELNKT